MQTLLGKMRDNPTYEHLIGDDQTYRNKSHWLAIIHWKHYKEVIQKVSSEKFAFSLWGT